MDQLRNLQMDRDDSQRRVAELESQLASMEQAWKERGEVIDELSRKLIDKDHDLRAVHELNSDTMAMLTSVRRALKPTAEEAPFPTQGIAVNRQELLETLLAKINEATGFLAGLGYEGELVRAIVALADRATELKHERDTLKRAKS